MEIEELEAEINDLYATNDELASDNERLTEALKDALDEVEQLQDKLDRIDVLYVKLGAVL